MTSYPLTKYKHFRVISPLHAWRSEERQAPEGQRHSGLSTPLADQEANGKVGLQSEDEVKKLRAELEYEKTKVQRLEREKTQLARELEDNQSDKERRMKQLSQEIDTLTKKFEEERKKNDEMMTMLMSERLNQETEALSKVDQALTDIQWKEDLEDQLKRKEERCKELEGILKSMEDKSRQNARNGVDGYKQPIVRAAACGDLETIRTHLSSTGKTAVPSPPAHVAEMDGTTSLHSACETGNSGCLQVLLENGGNPNAVRPRDKAMPLHLAAANGHKSCIELLLEHKVDLNAVDKQGYNSLCHAVEKGNHECVQILLKRGARIQEITKSGQTSLHLAATGGFHQCLQSLLNYAERQGLTSQMVNRKDRDGWTAIHLAARKDHSSCLALLLGCNAISLSIQDNWGRTAIDLATTTECKDMLRNRVESQVLTVHLTGKHKSPVGIVRVNPHSQWDDIDQAVGNALAEYSKFLNGDTGVVYPVTETPRCLPHITLDEVDSGMKKLIHHSPMFERPERQTSRDSGIGDKRAGSGSLGSTSSLPNQATGQGSLSSTDSPFTELAEESRQEFRLCLDSVKQCEVGRLVWAIGDAPSVSNSNADQGDIDGLPPPPPFLAFKEFPLQLTVHLKDMLHDGELDQMASDLLIPKTTLKTYFQLMEDSKAVVLCGPTGTRKSYLAQQLAEALKDKLSHGGGLASDITHVALSNGFTRSDLLYLMHSKGFLVSAKRQGGADVKDGGVSARKMPSIMVLDNLEKVSVCEIFAEVLTALNYRGAKNSLWLNAVSHTASNGEIESFHEGRYYLKQQAYFIATMDKHGSTDMEVPLHRCFKWIACQFDTEPVRSLLQRDLRRQLLALGHGKVPSSGDELFQWTEWVWRVWQRLNHCAALLELPELLLGLNLFASCPLETKDSKAIVKWFTDLWNFGVAPCVQDVILRNGSSSRIVAGHSMMASSVLLTMIYKAIIPECPLEQTELRRFAESLVGYNEGHRLLQDLNRQVKNEKPSHGLQSSRERSPRDHRKTPSPTVLKKMASLPEGQEGFLNDENEVTSTPVRENHRQVQERPQNGSPSAVDHAREKRETSPLADAGVKKNGLPAPPLTEMVKGHESPKDEGNIKDVKRSPSRAGAFARRLFSRLKPRSNRNKPHPPVDRECVKSSSESVDQLKPEPERQSPEKQKQRPTQVVLQTQNEHNKRPDNPGTPLSTERSLRPPQVQSSKARKTSPSTSLPGRALTQDHGNELSQVQPNKGRKTSPAISLPGVAPPQDQGNVRKPAPSWRDRNLDRSNRSGSFRMTSSSSSKEKVMSPVRQRANSDVGLLKQPLGLKPRVVKQAGVESEVQPTSSENHGSQDLGQNKVVTVADVHVGVPSPSGIPVHVKRSQNDEKVRSKSHRLLSDSSHVQSPVRKDLSTCKEKSKTMSFLGSGMSDNSPGGARSVKNTRGRLGRQSQV